MAINVHDGIIDAILTLLQASPALVDGDVAEEISLDTLPEGVDSDLSVTLMDSSPGAVVFGRREWTTTLRISSRARADEAGAGGRASRAVHTAAYARIMADRTLGGLVDGISAPRLSTDTAFLASRIGVLHADYVISHFTDGYSLEQA